MRTCCQFATSICEKNHPLRLHINRCDVELPSPPIRIRTDKQTLPETRPMKRAQLVAIVLLMSVCLVGCRRMGNGGLFGRRGAPCGNYAPYAAAPYAGQPNPYAGCAPAAMRAPAYAPPACATGGCAPGGYTNYSSGAFGSGAMFDGGAPMEMGGPGFDDGATVSTGSPIESGPETIGPGYSAGPAILTGVTEDRAMNSSNELPGPRNSGSDSRN